MVLTGSPRFKYHGVILGYQIWRGNLMEIQQILTETIGLKRQLLSFWGDACYLFRWYSCLLASGHVCWIRHLQRTCSFSYHSLTNRALPKHLNTVNMWIVHVNNRVPFMKISIEYGYPPLSSQVLYACPNQYTCHKNSKALAISLIFSDKNMSQQPITKVFRGHYSPIKSGT